MLRPLGVHQEALGPGVELVELYTTAGLVSCVRHEGRGDGDDAVALFLGGALGGMSGPAAGLYGRVARRTGGVRLHYRRPGEVGECVLDALLVTTMLAHTGNEPVVLVGHSFGGAVAVAAGVELGEQCSGVCTLATQVPGAERVGQLDAPLLVIHGDADVILPVDASRYLHELASEPKELVVVPGEGHLFEGVSDALTERVTAFVADRLG